jgi:hypothetical protein
MTVNYFESAFEFHKAGWCPGSIIPSSNEPPEKSGGLLTPTLIFAALRKPWMLPEGTAAKNCNSEDTEKGGWL